MKKIFFAFLFLFVLANPQWGRAGDLGQVSDMLFVLSDLVRSCDNAYDVFHRMDRNDRDYDRYDREWRDLEKRLEAQRVLAFASLAGLSESVIRDLRRQWGWDYLCDKYHIDRKRFYYGFSVHDHDRDKWKGVPPGQAKKGKIPPGHAKKHKKHHDD